LDTTSIAIVLFAFLCGGIVKGVIGLGLPLVSVAVMSSVLPLRVAVPLLLVPVIITNIMQAVRGGRMAELLRRYWSMLLMSGIGVWLGTIALYAVDPALLLPILGVVVCIYTGINLFAFRFTVGEASVPVVAPCVGLVSGLLSGTTGSLGVPIVIYLQALGLQKDAFVQALGITFLLTAVVWSGALLWEGGLNATNVPISAIALVPAVAGMWLGQKLRDHLDEEKFRKGLLVFLFLIGLNLIRKGLVVL
jgi:uncharacterized membrane protein YfcA